MKKDPNLSQKFFECIRTANKYALEQKNDQIGIEHILVALIDAGVGVGYLLLKACVRDLSSLRGELNSVYAECEQPDLFPEPVQRIGYSSELKFVLEDSEKVATSLHNNLTCTEHFIMSVLRSNTRASGILKKFGLTFEQVRQQYEEVMNNAGMNHDSNFGKAASEFAHSPAGTPTKSSKDKEKDKKKNNVIDTFCTDITELAKQGKLMPVIGREKEIERLQQVLARKTKNNPILLGESGVGKSAIIEGLAQKIIAADCPEFLRGKRILLLDLGSVVAGTKYRGQFEERLKDIIKEFENDPSIIAAIDEIHTVSSAGAAEGAMDAANMLKQPLARGTLRLIGLTTLEEYRRFIEKDRALERRFQSILVEAPNSDQTLEILKGLKTTYEDFHGVSFSDSAIIETVRMASRYIQDRFFPDKAIDIIDEAGSRAKIRLMNKPEEVTALELELAKLDRELNTYIIEEKFDECDSLVQTMEEVENKLRFAKNDWTNKVKEKSHEINDEEIAEVVSSITGIPLTRIKSDDDKSKLKGIEMHLADRIISQKDAISSASRAIRRGRLGLKEPNKPQGSFLFLGPTGVGKTQLAKEIAEYLFGDAEALIKIDMSEFMEKHSVSRLIGAPPGYVGHEASGQLEKVRKRPYSVVLFDEIEKAHPDVLNILLQILEDGKLTDNNKNVINFKHCIIIMTSNLGAAASKRGAMGFANDTSGEDDYERLKVVTIQEVKKSLRAELINRIDELIVFRPLTQEDCKEICEILVKDYNNKVFKHKGFELYLNSSVKEKLLEIGFDPEYGARPLKKQFQTFILDPLADYLLDLDPSLDKLEINCDLVADTVLFAYQKAGAPPAKVSKKKKVTKERN